MRPSSVSRLASLYFMPLILSSSLRYFSGIFSGSNSIDFLLVIMSPAPPFPSSLSLSPPISIPHDIPSSFGELEAAALLVFFAGSEMPETDALSFARFCSCSVASGGGPSKEKYRELAPNFKTSPTESTIPRAPVWCEFDSVFPIAIEGSFRLLTYVPCADCISRSQGVPLESKEIRACCRLMLWWWRAT